MHKGPERKKLRLENYDYSREGYYFVTICTKGRENFFGEIIDEKMFLNEYGKIVNHEIIQTQIIRKDIIIDSYIIMPNHIHIIIVIKNILVGCDCIAPESIAPESIAPESITSKNGSISNGTMQSFPTLSRVIRGLKGTITKQIRNIYEDFNFGWQKSFFDVIINNEDQLQKTRQYIIDNPLKWEYDKNNLININ